MRVQGLLIGLAAVGFLASPGEAADPVRVAMLPIVVHAAGGESDYLSSGLADMLSARLEQAGGIRVTRLEGAGHATTKPEAAIEAGRAAGADFVVFGSFTRFGDGASLDVLCARVTGDSDPAEEPREVFIQAGELGAIIPRLGDLSNRIVHYVTGGSGEAPEVGAGGESPGGSASLDDLVKRVEALERAVLQRRPAASAASGETGKAAEAVEPDRTDSKESAEE